MILVFSNARPAFEVLPLHQGAIDLGRGEIAGVRIEDKRMSRAHARVSFDGRAWAVKDLGSRNCTIADGHEVSGPSARPAATLVRTGTSLFLLAADARPLRAGVARSADAVMGPALQRAFAAIARAARASHVLHITGESGSGKELAARAFHDAGPSAAGPFIAVNAATLKPELAEAALFGARKGSYTNAPGGPGFVKAADGGTLFLDEVAELNASVQATLLRALQNKEVTPLGATKPEPVDFRFCSATNADLRSMVSAGTFREDLYYRVATPAVALPPLRERLEEIPWLIKRAVKSVEGSGQPLTVHASFVEACLLRAWPGNVRELIAEVKSAAQWASEDGGVLLAGHLNERAGRMVAPSPLGGAPSHPFAVAVAASASVSASVAAAAGAAEKPSDEAIEEALRAAGDNRSAAARALGMHRTQLLRWLEKRGRVAHHDRDDD